MFCLLSAIQGSMFCLLSAIQGSMFCLLSAIQGSMFCLLSAIQGSMFCLLSAIQGSMFCLLSAIQGSMFCSSAHYTRKHRQSVSPKEPDLRGRKSYGAPDSGFAATDSGIPRVLMAVKRWQRTRQTLCSCWLEEGEVEDCNKIIK